MLPPLGKHSVARLCQATLVSFLITWSSQCQAAGETVLEDGQSTSNSTGPDFLTIGSYLIAQVFHATLNDTFPTRPLISLSPSLIPQKSKLIVCPKSEVQTCMYYGNATNGLPDRVQGVWLAEGLGLPSDAISSAGPYDPKTRKLTISPLYTRAWAYQATSAVRKGLLWTPSGAGIYNANQAFGWYFDIYFNEDATFGQIYTGIKILGLPILLPVIVANFTMEWLGNDTWIRKSSIFFIPIDGGNYLLKRAVNGDGSKGPFYSEFLAYSNGDDIAVPVPA